MPRLRDGENRYRIAEKLGGMGLAYQAAAS